MSSLVEHVERAEIARWEAILNEEPQCEHPNHGMDERHSGPATHWCRTSCGHLGGLRCEGIVDAWRTKNTFLCSACGMIRRAFVHVEL